MKKIFLTLVLFFGISVSSVDISNQYHIYDLVSLIRVCTKQEFYISLEGLSFTEVSLLNDYVEQTMRAYYFDVA